MSACAFIGGFVAPALMAAPAAADTSTDTCIQSNNMAQTYRRERKFFQARAELATCASVSCPRLVRTDCVRRREELDAAQPTIVFEVKDSAGNDLVDGKVSVDGRPLSMQFTSATLDADPGDHEFTFEVAGAPPTKRRFVLKEGEKNRRERILVSLESHTSPAPAPEASPEPVVASPEAGGMGKQQIYGIVLGGLGVGGIAAGTVFGLLAGSASSAQKSDCPNPTSCPNREQALSDHDTLESDATISTVAFIAGGALLVTGAVLFLTGAKSSTPASAGVLFVPRVDKNRGGALLRVEF
jgi:hypothetical protein